MGDIRKREIKDVGASCGAGDGDDNKIRKIDDEVQAGQLRLGYNFHPDMDPKKLKQIIAHQSSAQRSKQKKAQYVAELEMQAKSLQTKIGLLHSQIEAYQNFKRALLIERQTMKLQIVVKEKERVLQEVEIERNKAEVNRLNELLRIQLEALGQIMTLNSSTAMSNSNSIPGLGQMVSTNSNQADYGGERPKEITNTAAVAEKQGQRFKVKSEVETCEFHKD